MSTFTIRVTSSATNAAGTAFGQQPDLGAPSYLDMIVSGSNDPSIPNGVYDAYCLNPFININLSPKVYGADGYAGNTPVSFQPIGFASLTTAQVGQVNWLLAQNFASDPKFFGQFNYGEVQLAIWRIVGFTAAQVAGEAGLQPFLTDNYRNVVDPTDIDFLVSSAESAVASGNGVLPADAFFTAVIDPTGNVQPLIVQLQSAKLGNFVWLDADADGIQDGEETGVDQVIVELWSNGLKVASTVTGDDYSTAAVEQGYYQFTGLAAGDYQVKFIAPSGQWFTTQDANGNSQDAEDSDANQADGLSQVVTLAAGQSNQTIDAGLVAAQPAAINGYVYCDDDNDGVKDGGEAGLSGVTVTLSGTDDLGQTVNATATTDGNGYYEFTGLRPGSYTVTETTQPADKLDGKDTAGNPGGGTASNEVISNIVLTPGLVSNDNNFGEILPAKLSGYVYEDAGDDGLRNNETAISGVTVTLSGTDDLGQAVSGTALTNAAGYYEFVNLRPGTYTVTETQPSAYVDGKDTAGSSGGSSASNDILSAIPLAAGQHSQENNFGELPKAAINGYVYCDDDNDGVKDGGEAGLSGVTVTLSGTDDLGQTVNATATTDGNGYYEFTGLRPGSYTVTETTQPADKLDGKDTAGNPGGGTASNEVISNIVLTPGLVSNDNNFGEILPAKLSGYVYEDAGDDGLRNNETAISGVTVTLSGTDDLGQAVSGTALTNAAGYYEFVNLRPGTYTVTETQPSAYVDGKDTAGSSGGSNASNDILSAIPLAAGQHSQENNFGELGANPGIDIEKTTNGASNSNPTAPDYDNEDAVNGAGVPVLTPGSQVTWTYQVTNTGNTSIAAGEIAIVDDNGTLGNTADDLTVANGKITYLSGDLGGDNILSAGETWLYQAMGTVQDLTTAGASSTFNFSGSSSQNGTDGNVRTYTAGGISVHVSAFSRVDGHNGAWSQAWLGSYGGGLGVTDSGEGSGGNNTHTVDNTGGRDNYVLFEFDQQVIVDSAFLGYVVNDSDLQIWIGTRSDAFNNHDTMLSDAELTALGFTEVNTTTLSTARLADLNAGNLAGNVLVIAADTTDCSPEDMFKIEKLVVETLGPPGIYENRATVTAQGATDTDLSHYTNPADVVSTPGIDIEKFVNGIDVVNPHDLPAIAVGADVTFTYTVKNTGNVAFSKAQVLVVDDNGTADDSSDDFTPTLLASSDVGGDGILSAGETWQYRSVTTQAKDLSTITESEANFVFSASTSTTGAVGNIRAFSANGLSVDVSGFSRDGSGNWAKGYVGVYSSGLGVTNATESGSNHRVDNGSQVDYLMFEFDRDVVVDRAFLNAVVSDSDISIWIGDRNGADIALPSDGLLSSFFSESNFTSSSSARWADLNNGELSGDTLIISAYTGGSNDQFKVNKLDTAFIEAVGGGAYRNIATVTAGDVSDSDASGYKNSAPVAKASLGDKVWCDTNANGLQDVGEAGVAGVTVKLLDAANVVTATTVTDTHGNYSFADLNPGNYSLKVVKPTAYGGFTEQDKGGNSKDALDSDVDSTGKSGMITLLAGENNTSWDAGLTPPRVNIEYNFNGSSATDGGDGNVRSYTAGGVTVTARAVSSHVVNKANVWETAWLGAYSGGHGVTDRSEGSGSSNNTHTVDNVGRINYVIYQFSENVVVDKAYLGYVIGDSDLTAWIGSSTGTLTNLSDSLLAGMSKEDNTTSSSSTRWAISTLQKRRATSW
jgi:protocatechuate 3,4-dioxygenase beta subunit